MGHEKYSSELSVQIARKQLRIALFGKTKVSSIASSLKDFCEQY